MTFFCRRVKFRGWLCPAGVKRLPVWVPLASPVVPLRAKPKNSTGHPAESSYDLLIEGGKLIAPPRGSEGQRNGTIKEGRIARTDLNIAGGQARKVIKADRKIAALGRIDLPSQVSTSGCSLHCALPLGHLPPLRLAGISAAEGGCI